jgi:DNA-directed RNA polymerase beta' subunit
MHSQIEQIKRVKKISFAAIDSHEFPQSVCEIVSTDLYGRYKEPKNKGINDLHMGTINDHNICYTCSNTMYECPGHFGHINLTEAIYNPMFFNTVFKLLNIICSSCSRILMPIQTITSIAKMYYNIKTSHYICRHCSFDQSHSKYIKDGMILLNHNLLTHEKTKFYARQTLLILQKMEPQDIYQLGIDPHTSHPKNFLFVKFPVVPPCIRPCINFGCNLRSEDDIV